jgi:hypothetical protein
VAGCKERSKRSPAGLILPGAPRIEEASSRSQICGELCLLVAAAFSTCDAEMTESNRAAESSTRQASSLEKAS